MCRLHAVLVPPRPGLLLGLRVFSVYAPLRRDPTRDEFTRLFLELVAMLDMQIPTLLLGDFNGSVSPSRDYSSGEGSVCGLLSRLLGPGGPFMDLQLLVSPDLYAHTFHVPHGDRLHSSRGDLALGNRAVLPLIARVSVASGIMDGGHSPLILDLRDSSAWALNWHRPRPRLPPLLLLHGKELRAAADWKALVQQWECTAAYRALLQFSPEDTAQVISTRLQTALNALVDLAGGWSSRSPVRRLAFESQAVRHTRATLKVLGHCLALVAREQGVGAYSHSLLQVIAHLRRQGLSPPAENRVSLQAWVEATVISYRRHLSASLRAMRAERAQRWTAQVPQLWKDRPGALYRWLAGDAASWGSTPILNESGQQCTTPSAVDAAVQGYWVRGGLAHARVRRPDAQLDGLPSLPLLPTHTALPVAA